MKLINNPAFLQAACAHQAQQPDPEEQLEQQDPEEQPGSEQPEQ